MVVIATSIVVVVVVVKVMVCNVAVIGMVVIVEVLDVRADKVVGVEIIVLPAVAISSKFAVSISYVLKVLSVVACVTMGLVTVIGVEVLTDANLNTFTALEFAVPKRM